MHLAGLLVQHLKEAQPGLGITNRDVQCVMLAGLCHDLGHGPWSHVWDGLFIPKALPGLAKPWTHEQGSELMFDYLVRENNIDRPQADYDFIKALIAGEPERVPDEKVYLFDIISNKRNGMDVDKFDYLLRDSKMLGMMHNGIDGARIIRSARVIDNQICYEIKDADSLYEVGELRYKLHKKIYHHKTAKAIEYMIIDALILAEPHLKIAERVFQPEKYVHLTDEVMGWIEASEDVALRPAQAILTRIRKRDHYRRVDHGRFGWFEMDMCKRYLTPEAITREARRMIDSGECNFANAASEGDQDGEAGRMDVDGRRMDIDGGEGGQLDKDEGNASYPFRSSDLPDDNVIVALSPLHYGMKDKNPLEGLKFYNRKLNPERARPAGPGDYSTLAPEICGEVLIQIFTKQKRFYGVVQNAYRRVVKALLEMQLPTPVLLTPDLSTSAGTPPVVSAPSGEQLASNAHLVHTDNVRHVTPPSTPPRAAHGSPTAERTPRASQGSHVPQASSPRPAHGSPPRPAQGSPSRSTKPLSTLQQSSFSEVPLAYDGTPASRKPKSRLGRSASGRVFGDALPDVRAVTRKREPREGDEDEEGRRGKKRKTSA